jgi:hypothetical protein
MKVIAARQARLILAVIWGSSPVGRLTL